MIAPALVPQITSAFTPARSSARSTPIWASPRMPPPPRARPIQSMYSGTLMGVRFLEELVRHHAVQQLDEFRVGIASGRLLLVAPAFDECGGQTRPGMAVGL